MGGCSFHVSIIGLHTVRLPYSCKNTNHVILLLIILSSMLDKEEISGKFLPFIGAFVVTQ
jgi:hypothetical protein